MKNDKAKKIFNEGASRISRKDVMGLIDRRDDVLKLGRKLKGLYERVKTLFSMIEDYVKGNYKEVPWALIASAAFAIAYLLMPADAIPDMIPVVGLTDDAFVLSLVFAAFSAQLDAYSAWKKRREPKNGGDSEEAPVEI